MSRIRSLVPIVLLAMFCRADLSFAVTHVPAEAQFGIVDLARADSVLVMRVRPEPISKCDWDFTDSLRFTHCHQVVGTFEAPVAWSEDLADLLTHSEMGPWDRRCGYSPQAIVRFEDRAGTSDLVILTGACDPSRLGLLLIVPGSPMEYRELRTGREGLLALMEVAFSARGERPTVADRTGDFPGAYLTMLEHADSPSEDFPSEGEFVYYDEEPVVVTRIEPTYSEFAKEAQIQGKVTLHVLVGAGGRVKDVRVIKGVTGLNDAAVDAVKRWVFRPATREGKPVAVWVEIPMDFHR